jgi:hypothetical protein
LQLDPGSLWFAHACPIGEHSGTPEADVSRSSRRVTHDCGTPSPAPTGPPFAGASSGGALSRVEGRRAPHRDGTKPVTPRNGGSRDRRCSRHTREAWAGRL